MVGLVTENSYWISKYFMCDNIVGCPRNQYGRIKQVPDAIILFSLPENLFRDTERGRESSKNSSENTNRWSKLSPAFEGTLGRIFPNKNCLMIYVFEGNCCVCHPCPSGDGNRFLSKISILALRLLFVWRSRFQKHFWENCQSKSIRIILKVNADRSLSPIHSIDLIFLFLIANADGNP